MEFLSCNRDLIAYCHNLGNLMRRFPFLLLILLVQITGNSNSEPAGERSLAGERVSLHLHTMAF